jgi:hypothetical protein
VAILGSADAEPAVQAIAAEYAAKSKFTPVIFRGSSMGAVEFGAITLSSV